MNAAHADCDAQGNGVSPAVCVEMRLLWAIIWFAASQEETAEVVTDEAPVRRAGGDDFLQIFSGLVLGCIKTKFCK